MRLWHYKIISGLSDSQLISLYKECVRIRSMYRSDLDDRLPVPGLSYDGFLAYSHYVIQEMACRRSGMSFAMDFYMECARSPVQAYDALDSWNTDRYFIQCFYILQERYDREYMTDMDYARLCRVAREQGYEARLSF